MRDIARPMSPERLRALMTAHSIAAYLEQRRNERAVIGSRLSYALAAVRANRTGRDWAWLDQDRALHQP